VQVPKHVVIMQELILLKCSVKRGCYTVYLIPVQFS